MAGFESGILAIADYTGVAVFAATGVLASSRRQMDWVGAIVLAIVTSIGGGTLRDVLTGQLPVFWIRQPLYLWIAVGTALVMLPVLHLIRFPERVLVFPDAVGLALFTWLGCEKVALLGFTGIVVVLFGVITGTAGGLIRDVLSAQIPNIMRKGAICRSQHPRGGAVRRPAFVQDSGDMAHSDGMHADSSRAASGGNPVAVDGSGDDPA